MSRAASLTTLWRILREVDLEAIRQEAVRPFRLAITGDDPRANEHLARLLTDPETASLIHPWIRVVPPDQVLAHDIPADLVLVLLHRAPTPDDLEELWRRLGRVQMPRLVVLVGSGTPPAPTPPMPQDGKTRWVAVPQVDRNAVESPLAQALIQTTPPHLLLSLARHLAGLRPAVFQHLIQETAQANATFAFSTGIAEVVPLLNVPLNVGDTLVLTKNQLVMAYKLALAAGKSGSPRELIGEILGVLGGGFLFRQIARELVGLVPVWGVLPKTAVAYAGTWAIGQAVLHWATEGAPLPREQLHRLYQEALERGRAAAQALAQRVRSRR